MPRGIVWLWILVVVALPVSTMAQTNVTSSNFQIWTPTIDGGADDSSSASFGAGQSIYQAAPGASTSTNFQVWSGFQYYGVATTPVLAATPASGQVALSWTASSGLLGIDIVSYNRGVGTSPGSLVYTSVGNVLVNTVTGLTNGTTYYFAVQAVDQFGHAIATSNIVSATPVGSGSSGGGSPGPLPSPEEQPAGVELIGYAYPSSIIRVYKDGIPLLSFNANPDARFKIPMSVLQEGMVTIGLQGSDVAGRASRIVQYDITLQAGRQTTVQDIILPPTINVAPTEAIVGGTVVMEGASFPLSTVTLIIAGDTTQAIQVPVDRDGGWRVEFNTTTVPPGRYVATAQTRISPTLQSPVSIAIPFRVNAAGPVVAPPVTAPTTPTGPQECLPDITGNGVVDAFDFSIFLYNWGIPQNPQADFTRDGLVDVRDFSILVYYWGQCPAR